MPSLAIRFVIAVMATFAWAASAQAAWEAPQMLDQTTEGFGNSGAGDVAVGDNGLASILFLQNDDDGAKLWATRRAASDPSWAAPLGPVTPLPSGAFAIEAAPDGATAGAYWQTETDSGTPLPGDEETTHHVEVLGWPADQSAAAPKTASPGDEGAAELPAVDADGKGFGWTAFIDGSRNVQIFRVSLTTPGTGATQFTIAPTARDPIGNESLNETLARSNPRIDVNADGDVIVSFVERKRIAEPEPSQPQEQTAVWAVRKLSDKTAFTGPFQISQEDERDPVTDHDPAIVENGDATILFAADPERNASTPTGSPGPDRVFARRWLATGAAPRNPDEGPEFVSSSDEEAPDVSRLRAEAGPDGRVTAAWSQGAQLNSAERFGTWTFPETLSTNTAAFDVTVDVAGVATAVYRENTVVRARRRSAGQKWAAAEAISTAPVPTDFTPKVDAGMENQADAYILQTVGSRRAAFATRFTGAPPVEPPAPVKPDTLDCPGDLDVPPSDGGANTIAGGDGRESILGGDGDDTLSGNGGDDCIRGQAGNDTASGGSGNDDVGGGDGDDRVAGDDGADRVHGDAGTDTVNGGAGDDNGLGGDGNDTLSGGDGNDTLNGETGDDKVRGGNGDDILGGAEGNDTVSGNAGANALFGGIGNDRLLGGPQNDRLFGQDGDDVLFGGAGPDTLSGGAGNDKLRGGAGKNTLAGGAGNDGMRGGAGVDRILGSAGLDTLFGFGGRDNLVGGAAADKAYGGNGADRLSGNAGADRLRGGKGGDRIFGGAGGDRLNGEGGRDRVFGGAGNDRVYAADGKRDRINCGAGRDRVVMDDTDIAHRSCEKVRRKS